MKQHRFVLPGLIGGILIIFLLMMLLVRLLGSGNDVYMSLAPDVTAEIITAEGNQNSSTAADNVILGAGDAVVYHVRIPETLSISDPVLCFYEYNSVVTVEYHNRILYTYGEDIYEKGEFIGDLVVRLRLPEDAPGETLTVTVRNAQREPANRSAYFGLMSAWKAWKYPILGHETEFIIYFAIVTGSLIMLVFVLITGLYNRSGFRAALLLLFAMLVCMWYMGYNRFLYVLSDRTEFNARAEYYALAYAPVPLLSYLSFINRGRWRSIYRFLLVLFSALAIFSTTATLLPVPLNFTDTLSTLQSCLIVFALTMLVQLISVLRGKTRISDDNRVFLYGFTAAAVMAAFQVLSLWVRNNRSSIPGPVQEFLELDFASVGILVFLMTLVYSYAVRTTEEVVRKARAEELQKLAYMDLLSGIHNRSYCVKQMEEMQRAGQREYTVVFMDADGLKHANDVYGHETGDALIRCVAEGIRTCFGDSRGFFGRWGGDEFVAFFYRKEEAEAFCRAFEAYEKKVNEEKKFPFLFSISIGLCESTELSAGGQGQPEQAAAEPGAGAADGSSQRASKAAGTAAGQRAGTGTAAHDAGAGADPTMVINEADRRMYEHKKAAKKARSQITQNA